MSALNNILFRNEPQAAAEAKRGYHHACYLFSIVSKLLSRVDIEIRNHDTDPVSTGAHWGRLTDPVTGIEYELRLTPLDKK